MARSPRIPGGLPAGNKSVRQHATADPGNHDQMSDLYSKGRLPSHRASHPPSKGFGNVHGAPTPPSPLRKRMADPAVETERFGLGGSGGVAPSEPAEPHFPHGYDFGDTKPPSGRGGRGR